MKTMGRTDLPPEQQEALRKAIGWEVVTIVYTAGTIVVIAFVVGGSQAMRTAWIEDMLSLIPQVSFLVSLLFIRRRPTRRFPYGLHQAMEVGHLVSGVALMTIGIIVAWWGVDAFVGNQHLKPTTNDQLTNNSATSATSDIRHLSFFIRHS